MGGLQKEVSAVKESVAESISNTEKSRDLRGDAGRKTCLAEMELSLIDSREKCFEKAMAAISKELSAARVECAAIQRNRDQDLSNLKM